MFEGYEFRWLHEGDLDDYITGLNETLYDRYDEERFHWKFDETSHSIGFNPVVAVEERRTGRLVGFNAFLPLEIRLGGKVFLALQGCDGFIAREHRRRGLFQETIRFMVDEMAGRGPEFLIGFNFEGSTAAARKAGSTPICDINMWSLNTNALDKYPAKNNIAISLELCGADHAYGIYNAWAEKGGFLHIHRNLEYLEWRFSRSPLKEYSFYSITKDGSESGYVVAGVVEDDKGKTILGLDDQILLDTQPAVVSQVLSGVVDQIDDVNTVETLTPVGGTLDRVMGLLGGRSKSRYTMILKGISFEESSNRGLVYRGVELSRSGGWHITTSDIF